MSFHQVIVADDQPLLRGALGRTVLGIVPDATVTEVDSLAMLHYAAERHPVALLLLSLAIPGVGGLASVRTLRAEFPELRIALICGTPSSLRVRAAQALGTVGYLYKSTPAEQRQLVADRAGPCRRRHAGPAHRASVTAGDAHPAAAARRPPQPADRR
jgi:DNA-binding NarL/FixJ family response regulator